VTTVVLSSGVFANDVVECVAYIPRGLSDGYTTAQADARYPQKSNNLSDLGSASTARTNLGLGTLATVSPSGSASSTTFLRGDNSWQTVSVTPTAVSSQANSATDYFALPSGTTAQRPASPVNGMVRYNSNLSSNEIYQAGQWNQFNFSYQTEYLIVAGGGGGGGVGNSAGGGGGAGGLLSGFVTVAPSSSYTITVGAGGAQNNNGSNSSYSSTTALGGGYGGQNYDGTGTLVSRQGNSGGSGGGSAKNANVGTVGGAGTSGQGYAGGGANAAGSTGGGGGGGAGGVGEYGYYTGSQEYAGNGGVGLNYSTWATATSTGVSGYYAGGGGGGVNTGTSHHNGSGGAGGGAGAVDSGTPSNATANTGGGGAGGIWQSGNGSSGGSGIVIIRYLGSQRGSGGTVTSSGGYTYHTFTSSGTFTG
jgi:hypothetical protein